MQERTKYTITIYDEQEEDCVESMKPQKEDVAKEGCAKRPQNGEECALSRGYL